MRELELVDNLYDAFVRTLDVRNAEAARGLAHTLGLAPSPEIPWSQVFGHEVSLAAPALVAESMPRLSGETVRAAVLAHMFSVIEAFATDRIEDGQVGATPELRELLPLLRRSRDVALRTVCGPELARSMGYEPEDRTMRHAINSERELLASGR